MMTSIFAFNSETRVICERKFIKKIDMNNTSWKRGDKIIEGAFLKAHEIAKKHYS